MHDIIVFHARYHDISWTIIFYKMYSVFKATIMFSNLFALVLGFRFTLVFARACTCLACKNPMYHLNKIKLKWRIRVFSCFVCCSLFLVLMSSVTLHLIMMVVKLYMQCWSGLNMGNSVLYFLSILLLLGGLSPSLLWEISHNDTFPKPRPCQLMGSLHALTQRPFREGWVNRDPQTKPLFNSQPTLLNATFGKLTPLIKMTFCLILIEIFDYHSLKSVK